MQLTIQIISYSRLNARADRIFRGAHMSAASPVPFTPPDNEGDL